MTRINFLIIDGRSVPEDTIERITEYRCDACEKHLPADDVVYLGLQMFTARQGTAGLPQFTLHLECVKKYMPFAHSYLHQQGWYG